MPKKPTKKKVGPSRKPRAAKLAKATARAGTKAPRTGPKRRRKRHKVMLQKPVPRRIPDAVGAAMV